MKIKHYYLINVLLYFFVIFTLLFPTTIINKIFFLTILLLFFHNVHQYKFITISPFLIIFIFFYGYLLSFFNDSDRGLSNQFVLSTLTLILIYPILNYKINFDKIVKVSGLFLTVYSIISFVVVVLLINFSISEQYFIFFKEYSAGSNGLREFTEEGIISFHAGTAPFMYLSLILFFESFIKKKSLPLFLIILAHLYAIFISGSRGIFLTSLLSIFIFTIYKVSFKTKFTIFAIGIPSLLIFINYLILNTDIFSANEMSNSVKIGHYESFINNINEINFVFGNGLASRYFSKGTNTYLAHTEITPIDMIRYLGFFLAFLLYWLIIFPTHYIKAYLGNNFLYLIVFIIYLLNSMTNPTMFNSYGLLVVIWYWYKILQGEDAKSISQTRL